MIVANKIQHIQDSLIGPRTENQDSFRIEVLKNSCLAVLADGVGGRNCGAIASKSAIDFFYSKIAIDKEVDLIQTIEDVNKELILLSNNNKKCDGMATTFTACIINNDKLTGVHVGDSRLCILRGNGIKQLTMEHSEAGRLLREGLLEIDQYNNYPRKNILESALGVGNYFDKQIFSFSINIGDRIVLSTDGFHNLFTKTELRDMSVKNKSLSDFNKYLQKELSKRKLTDNASYIVLEIL